LACSVCKENCDGTSDKRLAVTKCGHIFHYDCIMAWWESLLSRAEYRKCPICKTETYYNNLMEIFPTFQTNITLGNLLEMIENANDHLKAEELKCSQLREKLDESNVRVGLLRQRFSLALHKIEALNARLEAKANEASDWELRAEYLDESLTMFMQSNEELKDRVDGLQQKCDLLHSALINRTRSLFDRCNERTRQGRTDQVSPADADGARPRDAPGAHLSLLNQTDRRGSGLNPLAQSTPRANNNHDGGHPQPQPQGSMKRSASVRVNNRKV